MPARSRPRCEAAGLGSRLDLRNEKINYKVREHSLAHVPVIVAVGRREAEHAYGRAPPPGSETQEVLELGEAVTRLAAEAPPPDLRRRSRSSTPRPLQAEALNDRRRSP